jgi:iron-sulfur cluster assembly protein
VAQDNKSPGAMRTVFWASNVYSGDGNSIMSIRLTDNAAERVKAFLEKEQGIALRLGVRKTGCSGWAYDVSIASELQDNDELFEDKGVKIAVDRDSLPYLQGSSIDFITTGLNRTFQFDNPNATDECGCGESFTIAASA